MTFILYYIYKGARKRAITHKTVTIIDIENDTHISLARHHFFFFSD